MGDLAEWIRLNRRAEVDARTRARHRMPQVGPGCRGEPPSPIGTLLPSVTTAAARGHPGARRRPARVRSGRAGRRRRAVVRMASAGHGRLGVVFPSEETSHIVRKILIVGGGYAGFYTAWKLEKWLRKGEADVTMVDPLPYMTYQPFLPEVAAGSIEPRHARRRHRRHLKRTKVITAKVTDIDHADKTATITPEVGEPWELEYDLIVVTAGAVSRTFPIPGIADNAIGLKTIEEAVAIRDRIDRQLRQGLQPARRPRARPPAHLRRRRRRLRRHRGVRRAAQLRRAPWSASTTQLDFRRHALPPHRGDGPHHARGVAQDEPLGAQEPRPARRRGAPRHAARPAPSTATSSSRPARPSSPT